MGYYRKSYCYNDSKIYQRLLESNKYQLDMKKPMLSDFGLEGSEQDVQAKIKKQDETIDTINSIVFGTGFLFSFIMSFYELKIGTDITGIMGSIVIIIFCLFTAFIFSFFCLACIELFVIPFVKYIYTNIFLKEKTIREKYSIYQKVLEEYTLCQKLKKAEYWLQMDGYEFEKATALVFQKLGYSVKLTKIGADGGIDIIVNYKNGVNIPVQCKAHNKPIGVPFLREFYGVMIHNDYTQGIFVSRSGYTSYVQDFIKDKQITLLDLSHLIQYTD